MQSDLTSFAQTHPVLAISGGLIMVNLLTIAAFWYDKRQARNGGMRVPERRLLLLAAFGGTPAAFWARQRFRHKTRKQPFSSYLNVIVVLQIVSVAAFVWAMIRG